ncbi:zinc metalloproteinase nas-7 [Solenopsis invicta]|uniref:zinc metalloproteinase nas-7 n=1 Tax=Solenopsis invicta TaxID=13686 RepID=UPI00193E7875|nr:zinc metalloproteinase nas-7 [Solenopsis invicta]
MLRRQLVIFVLMIFVPTIFASTIFHTRDLKESHMMIPDKETGVRVAQWTKEMNVNPEELGSYYQGDIILTHNTQRSGVTDKELFWPNGEVPYVIEGDFNKAQRDLILKTICQYHEYTCIRFVPKTEETTNYIAITSNNTGCHSNVGMKGGRQIVNLQIPGCVTKIGTVEHEFMHCLGCWHEHTRWDRDNYVTINTTNIEQKHMGNFVKDNPNSNSYYGTKYNYNSIMHYSRTAFTKNGEDTIIPNNTKAEIGQREGFSEPDLQLINTMYCKKSC